MVEKQQPNRFTEQELRKFSVQILDHHTLHLRCEQCGQIWAPNLGAGGRLPRGYWHCPNGCNSR